MAERKGNGTPPAEDTERLRAVALLDNSRVLANGGRFQEALEMVEQAITADPTFDRSLLAKAFILAQLGRPEEALGIVDEYLLRDPDNAYAHTTRGTCLMEAGRDGEAEAAFRKGVRLGGEEYLHSYNYACFLARAGREEEVRKQLGRALALAPRMNARAATDPDFEPYRDREWFRELVAFKG